MSYFSGTNTVVSSNLWKLRIYFDCYNKKRPETFAWCEEDSGTVRVEHEVASKHFSLRYRKKRMTME
jgi:hypothetical protein